MIYIYIATYVTRFAKRDLMQGFDCNFPTFMECNFTCEYDNMLKCFLTL